MDVPPNDDRIKHRKCIDFIRSSSICGSDTTSVFFDKLQPREQINQLTSFIDGSQVRSRVNNFISKINNINFPLYLDIWIYKRSFIYTT